MHLTCVCIFNAFLLFFFSFHGQLIFGILDILLQQLITRALFLLSRRRLESSKTLRLLREEEEEER